VYSEDPAAASSVSAVDHGGSDVLTDLSATGVT
jgi:hypothetical protein